MAAVKVLRAIVLAVSIHTASAWCEPWSGAIQRDIQGTGMGGSSEWSLDSCKRRCVNTAGCQTAQYSDWGDYNGRNCFIYRTQNFNHPQLYHGGGWFDSYTYNPEKCESQGSWSNAIYKDIYGTGLGGTWAYGLQECKQRCVDTWNCQAAQYSSRGLYLNNCNAGGHGGCNCFIYDNQWDSSAVGADISDFYLYKYYRSGNSNRRRWFRRLQESTDNAVVTV